MNNISLSLCGLSGLKLIIQAGLTTLYTSQPLRAEWIEISKLVTGLHIILSQPLRAEWIEIILAGIIEGKVGSLSLCGLSGLKFATLLGIC